MNVITNIATTNVVKTEKNNEVIVNDETIHVNIAIMTKEKVTEGNSFKELDYATLSIEDKKIVDNFITFLKK